MDDGAIARWVADQTGINPDTLGRTRLQRAIERRLQASGEPQVGGYVRLLQRSEAEQQALVELLVVPETWFFRDRAAFAALARLGRERCEGPADAPPLRLLSAPCSSGEEPYSMAMTLLDLGLPTSRFHIDAIDICVASLDRARRALYGRHAFRGVDAAERQRYFLPSGQGWALKPEIRDCVQFRQGNLLHCLEPLNSHYDAVFCRNLLIYLHDEAIDGLLASIARLLRPGGLLLVGAAEMARVPLSLFEPQRQPESFAFRRRHPEPEGPRPAVAPSPQTRGPLLAPLPEPPTAAVPVATRAGGSTTAVELERCRALLQCDPTAVAIHLRMAELCMELAEPHQALRCLRKGLYLEPRSCEILQRLIAVHRSMGNLEESQRFEARLARLARLER